MTHYEVAFYAFLTLLVVLVSRMLWRHFAK